jgi:hypothetical protein
MKYFLYKPHPSFKEKFCMLLYTAQECAYKGHPGELFKVGDKEVENLTTYVGEIQGPDHQKAVESWLRSDPRRIGWSIDTIYNSTRARDLGGEGWIIQLKKE